MDKRVIALYGLAVCVLTIIAGGCAAPVKHPRTADVLDARELRLRLGTVLFATAPTSAQLESGDEALTASGEYSDPWTAQQVRSRSVVFDAISGILFSVELQAAYSPFGGCEGGALLSFIKLGAELRCAALKEDWGAPFSLALSAGAGVQVGYLAKERRRDGSRGPLPRGYELHAGVDLSTRLGEVTPLLNVNVGYGRQMREILSGLPGGFEGDHYADEIGNILIARDELRLSIPVGFAIEYPPRREGAQRTRIIFALVPEITLEAWDRWAQYHEVPGSTVTDIEQQWALYLTFAAESEW